MKFYLWITGCCYLWIFLPFPLSCQSSVMPPPDLTPTRKSSKLVLLSKVRSLWKLRWDENTFLSFESAFYFPLCFDLGLFFCFMNYFYLSIGLCRFGESINLNGSKVSGLFANDLSWELNAELLGFLDFLVNFFDTGNDFFGLKFQLKVELLRADFFFLLN